MAITLRIIVIFGVSTLTFASSSQFGNEISCEKPFDSCDDTGLQHVPTNVSWHFSLEGFWNLVLPDVKRSPSEDAEDGESFGGLFTFQKIGKCEIKITFNEMFVGNEELNITETFVAKYDKNSARMICGKRPKEGQKTDYLIGLSYSIISAFTNPALKYGLLKKGNVDVLEDDQYGKCATKYELQKSSKNKFMVKKRRNNSKCSTSFQKLVDEVGNVIWYPRKMENYVENSNFGCDQYYVNNEIRNIKCFQSVTDSETAQLTSEIAIIYLKTGPTPEEDDIRNFTYPYKELPSSSLSSQEELLETIEESLRKICVNSKNGVNNDVPLLIPKLLTTLNVLDKDRIINIYRNVQNQIYCEGNKYFKTIFESVMKDTISPAAASAKCQIILENGIPEGSNWENSLGFTILPTDQTLGYCSELLRQPSWTELVGSVSALANTYKENHCRQNWKNFDACSLGENFNSITKNLWTKARNCHNHGEEFQKMALYAIKGLSNMDAIGSDVTATLVSCVNSVVATSEVKIASLRALSKKTCSAKIPLWIQSLIFKQELGTDVKIEAFKTLFKCNNEMARELLKMAADGEIDFKSSQVASYIDSFVSNLNVTNLFKLSRHFDLELDKLFGLKEQTRLEGDIIFEDSFIPRSLRMGLDSNFLKQFGGFAEVEIRQENLEDTLQPILGPEGLRGAIIRLLQEAILSFFDNFSNPKNTTDADHERQKRNINIEDIKTSLAKVKGNTLGKLKALVSAKLGKNRQFYSSFSFEPFFKNLEESIQESLDSWANKLYYSIANYELTKGYSWSLRSSEVVSWTFLGYSLHLKEHEGILGTLGMSSHIDLFSIIKSPFSPSVDAIFNPSVGGYWHSSMMFTGVDEVVESKTESLLQGGFDIHLKIKKKVEDDLQISLNLPMTSIHGYSATIFKDLITRNDKQKAIIFPSNERESLLKYREKGVVSKNMILNDPSVRIETERVDCSQELKEGLGLNSCFEFTEWKGEQSSLSHSRYGLRKDDEQIEKYNLYISTKNSGINSVFLSTQMETEGLEKKKEGIVVLGFNFSPHITLKVMAQTGNFITSFEGSIVNDFNLKRLEARSRLGNNEYGIKAELLMVRDGGQVSVKPRLVISRPHSKEDALLDGYIAHYDSDKVKSFTIDLLTDGSLKNVVNVAMKGTTEYRSKADGGWSISLKNLHIMTPGFEMGVESSLNVDDYNAEITNQVMWDGELFMMGASLNMKGITDFGKHYDLNFHFLTPSRPQWNTKLSLKTSFFDGQLTNNLTLLNGPEDERWQFDIYHLTTWKFVYDKSINDYKAKEHFNGLLLGGRTTKITNILSVSIPSQDWEWKLDHNFQASDFSVENLITLRHDKELYSIMTNVFDQSEKLFKYHMEIEVEFPEWKFGYVDTLLQRAEGDIIGQSVAVMPSGRVYTSSSRLKYENILGYLVLEMTYDTLVRDQTDEFRISFRHTLESTSDHVNFLLTLEAPHPLISIEFSVEGLETYQVDILLKAFMTKVFEIELSSRSFRGQTEVSVQMDLMSLSKQIKSTVAVGKKYSGGGNLDGEIVMSSPNNPSLEPVFIIVSSSLEMKNPGIYLVRSDLSLMGWGWSAEMKTELGKAESDPQMFTISVTLPDKSSFEGKSNLVIDFGKENQKFGVETELKLPSNVLYKLALTGESVFEEGSLAQAKLLVDIDSPFTNRIYLKTHFRNYYDGDTRNLTFFCDTHSEASYWNELYIDFNWAMEFDTANVTFEGKFGEKRLILESFGSYKIEKDIHNILMVSEVKLPSEGKDEQLKVSFDAHLYSSSNPPALKISQITYVQKNHIQIFESSGNLDINIPETKGSLTIIHTGERFTNQDYTMKGSFTGRELVISIQGMIDHRTPVRINVQYIDGETLKLSANYGGSTYASIDFVSQLEGFSLMLRNDISPNSKLTTSGNITYRNRHSRFHHVLRLSKDHSSSNLRINSLKGKPLKLSTSRTKLSFNQWKTEGKLEWGSIKTHYSDEIAFRSLKDFDIKARFHSPYHDLRHLRLHAQSSHDEETDRNFFVKYTRENVVINSGKFTIKSTSLTSSEPFEINAELADIVLEKQEYSDFKFRQFLVLPDQGLKMESSLKRGGIPLADIGLSVSEDNRAMLFSVCSTDTKCIRLNGQVNSFSQESPIRNFAIEIKFLNSLFGKRYYHDEIIEHTLTLNAENKLKRGDDIRLAAKLCRERCKEILCKRSTNIGKHHVQLKASHKNLDLLYETANRTMLLKSSLAKGINKKLSTDNSRLLKIKFWFDRIGKPDDVLIWTTSYEIEDSNAKVEETLTSTLHHPYVERAVSVTGKLSTTGVFKREAVLNFDIFEEPHHALQLYILKDYRVGGYILQVDLKSIEDKEAHISLSTALIPSPDSGVFNLRVDTPRLTVFNDTNSFSFKYNCKMEIDQDVTVINCQIKSPTTSDHFGLEYGFPPEICSGVKASSYVFNDTYKIHGLFCEYPLNIDGGISITENKDENLRAKIGFEDASNNFEIAILNVINCDVTLLPPFLLQGIFESKGTPADKLIEFKNILKQKWNSFITKSKILTSNLLHDSQKLSQIFRDIPKPSPLEKFSRIVNLNSKGLVSELKDDDLFVDLSEAFETSANISNVILQLGITYIDYIIGGNISIKPFSFYYKQAYNIVSNLGSKVYKNAKEEVGKLWDYARKIGSQCSYWFKEIYNYLNEETGIAEPLKWLIHKFENLTSNISWSPFIKVLKNGMKIVQKILSLFYSNVNYNTSGKVAVIIPLARSMYSLPNLFSLERGTEGVKTYPTVSLLQEIDKWKHMVSHPQQFAAYVFPHFNAQGIIVDDNIITFDGSSNIVDFSCPHLLLVLKESNSSTILSLAAGYRSLPFDGHKEMVLLYGENRIFIEHDRNIVFNNNSISLPYEHEGVSVQRDLKSIEITVKTSNRAKVLALNCEMEKDICIVEVNGWLYRDTFGLFGNFDNDPYNDFVLPDGSSVTNSEVWEDSWMTNQNCSKIVTGISYLKEPSQRALKFCSRIFLDNNSPAVPCHGSVNIHPYYVNCLNAQRALDYPTRKTRTTQYFPTEHDKITEEKEHDNNTSQSQLIYEDYDNNYKNVSDEEYNYLDDNFFYWNHGNDTQTQMRVKRSFENSFWKPTREHDIKISLHDISTEETRALCNVFSAYTKTCSSKSVNLILPLECDFSYLNHDDDPVHHSLSIDLLILYEESECSTFVYESVVSVIHENIIDLLNSSNIDLHIGVIGYESSEDLPVTLYGKGNSLLTPLEKYSPPDLHLKNEKKGSLLKGLQTAEKYPFRRGTIRVVFVASCSDQDIPKSSSILSKNFAEKRILLFSLTPKQLYVDPLRPKAARNIIGLNSVSIYHLRKGVFKQGISAKLSLPSSNVSHLSLQTGGSIFSIESFKEDKKFEIHMKTFRQILAKAIVQSSNKLYSKLIEHV